MQADAITMVDDLWFGEGPRYRDGHLFVSDQHQRNVIAVDGTGTQRVVARVPGGPSGLGWLPDGSLLIVSMHDRKVLALRDGVLEVHADLSAIATGHANDMVVDADGRAYVGNFGFDMDGGAAPQPAQLALVTPDGQARAVANDLQFPNGMVITDDGRTLVVAESFASRLTAFSIDPATGELGERRLWAQLPGPPDGICLDAEGCIWAAHPVPPGGYLRVAEGGEVRGRVDTEPGWVGIACMLGGPERRSLFMLDATTFDPKKTSRGTSRLRVVDVEVSGAGFP